MNTTKSSTRRTQQTRTPATRGFTATTLRSFARSPRPCRSNRRSASRAALQRSKVCRQTLPVAFAKAADFAVSLVIRTNPPQPGRGATFLHKHD